MSNQSKHERYWDSLMDKDLAQGFHSYCEKCGKNMDDETGYVCEDCRKKQELEETP